VRASEREGERERERKIEREIEVGWARTPCCHLPDSLCPYLAPSPTPWVAELEVVTHTITHISAVLLPGYSPIIDPDFIKGLGDFSNSSLDQNFTL
jgi:hypothetical protein